MADEPIEPARIVLGTAGHIDHGKTALVRALTGIDTDRLPEEKTRGITIDLGFAPLTLEGRRLAVIDVPGHERFVRTMVAGATGVDMVLLVVAADEGFMPQTREHLDICRLLGIPRGVVALSKADLCEPDWLSFITEDVRRELAGTFLERAAVVPCSALTGMGLPELRTEIARLASSAGGRQADSPLRLPLDRIFSLKGFGTVATGTLASGRLSEGEDVRALPGGTTGRVRSLQVHAAARTEASAGERVAVNLQGVGRDGLSRGEVLVRPDELRAASIVDVELHLLSICPAPLGARAKVLFHALTAHSLATVVLLEGQRLEAGKTALAQLHLDHPMALLPDDRFILRGFRTLPGYGTTVGGGRVVRIHGPRRRRADPATAALVRRMAAAGLEERVALEIEAAGETGVDRAGLRARLGGGAPRIDRALGALLSRREAIGFHREIGAVVAAPALESIGKRILEIVASPRSREALAPGIDREELRSRAGGIDPRLFAVAIDRLSRDGSIETKRELVCAKGRAGRPAEADLDAASARVLGVYRGAELAPPWSSELPARAGVAPGDAASALEVLVRRGDLLRVKPDLCFARQAVDALRDRLRRWLDDNGKITPQEWKEITGQSRKFAIPLAEHFDAEKLTIRVGEVRKLRGR